MRKSRFIVGLIMIAIAAGLFLFAEGDVTAPAVAFGVLGLTMVAISRRK